MPESDESISYEIHNADLDLIFEGVRKLAAEGGAFSRHDSIYSADIKKEDKPIDLASLLAGRAAADAVDIEFFPAGCLTISCEAVRCRLASSLTLIGRWPGRLDDPDVRPQFINRRTR